MPRDDNVLGDGVKDLAALIFNNVEDAAGSLPAEEREAYRAAQRSVVEARRRAETKEGLLRIR